MKTDSERVQDAVRIAREIESAVYSADKNETALFNPEKHYERVRNATRVYCARLLAGVLQQKQRRRR